MQRIPTTIWTDLYNVRASFVGHLRGSTLWCEEGTVHSPISQRRKLRLRKSGPCQVTQLAVVQSRRQGKDFAVWSRTLRNTALTSRNHFLEKGVLEQIWVGDRGVPCLSVPRSLGLKQIPSPWNLLSIRTLPMCRLSECTLSGGSSGNGTPPEEAGDIWENGCKGIERGDQLCTSCHDPGFCGGGVKQGTERHGLGGDPSCVPHPWLWGTLPVGKALEAVSPGLDWGVSAVWGGFCANTFPTEAWTPFPCPPHML